MGEYSKKFQDLKVYFKKKIDIANLCSSLTLRFKRRKKNKENYSSNNAK